MQDTPTPDPARVAIVQDATACTGEAATQAVISLDEYDAKATTTTETRTSSEGSGYASFTDLLPVGISALVAAGYDGKEAAFILQALFNGLAGQHGGKRLYLPKPERMLKQFENVEFYSIRL